MVHFPHQRRTENNTNHEYNIALFKNTRKLSRLRFKKIIHEINKPAGKDTGTKPQQLPAFLLT